MSAIVKWAALSTKAHAAGLKAAEAAVPTPIIVGQPTHPLGSDIDPAKPTYYVPQGLCGFAWVKVPGRGFGAWAVKAGIGRKAYGGGVAISAGNVGGQSIEIKEAYVAAYAGVLREAGVEAYTESRLD